MAQLVRECHCLDSKRKQARPLLAWTEGNPTRPVRLSLPPKIVPELEGLAQVTQKVVERVAGGDGVGDIGGDIEWILCYIICIIEKIWCIIINSGRPGGDILTQLCFLLSGDCSLYCSYGGGPPPWPP